MPSNNRDNIRATPARSESLAWLAEKLGQADDFARKPFGYDNPPVALISDLFDIPGVKKTLERVAYDEPLTKGKGLATRMHPETESALFAAPMAIGPTVGLSKLAAKYGAKAGHAGEALADRHITRIMDRGGLPAEMLQAMANKTISPATVWHGSPHKFDKFDASKIGTGEGAQAYGHGLYLAENKNIAQNYADNLSAAKGQKWEYDGVKVAKPWDAGNRWSLAGIDWLNRSGFDKARALENIKADWAESGNSIKGKDFRELKEWIDSADLSKITRDQSLYKVDLPDEHIAKMLDWDKPLSQQHPDVRKTLTEKLKSLPDESFSDWSQAAYRDKAIDALNNPDFTDVTGSGLYKFMQAQTIGSSPNNAVGSKGQDLASDYLRQAGIPGIRYLDGGSRGAGAGSSNFVVFPGNENMLQILERNGVPIPSSMQKEAIEKFVYPQREASSNVASESFISPTPKHIADSPAPLEYSGNVYYEPNDVRQKKLSDLFGAFGSKSDSNSFMSPTNARLLHEKGLLKASKKELNLLLDMTDSNGVIRPQIEGGFIYPQDKALKAAQRNASLPVSKGGLGLHTDNTPTERAEAMGFTGDTFHGTPDDRIVRSRQFKDEMLGKSTRVSDAKMGHFTVDDGKAASEYIWHDGSTDGGNVLPLKLAGDRGSVRLPGEWQPGRFDSSIAQAKADGLDGLTIQGTTTLGKPGDYQVTFDPKNLRSRFAAFDPMRRNESDLLAGALPLSALTYDDNRQIIDDLLNRMEYAKGGSVTRLTTGSGINTAHYADGGSVYSPDRVDEIVTQHRNSEYDPARVDALVAQLKEEMYG